MVLKSGVGGIRTLVQTSN